MADDDLVRSFISYRGHLALVLDELLDVRQEAVREFVHPADRLKKRRLPFIVLGLIHPVEPELGAENFNAWNGRLDVAGSENARLRRIPRALRADVLLVLERPEGVEQMKHLLLLRRRELVVERAFVDGLGQQLRNPAARVVEHAPMRHRLAVKAILVLIEIRARGHHVRLDGNLQLLAVSEGESVVIRKASRTGIQILILNVALEVAGLLPRLAAVRLDDLVAVADGVAASSGAMLGLEDDDRVSAVAFLQLIRGGQSRDAGAEDDDGLAAAGAVRNLQRIGVRGFGYTHHPQRNHRFINGSCAANAADRFEKPPASPLAHGILLGCTF